MRLRVGAAALDASAARAAADAGIGGLEFLRGVPGTIGGALRMNAGCYGREIKGCFVEATAIDSNGKRIFLGMPRWDFVYRKSMAPGDLVFVEAVLRGTRDEPDAIRARMNALVEERESSQPVRSKTGGSTFKNPEGRKAWQLIDEAGCRGLCMAAPRFRAALQFSYQCGRSQCPRHRNAWRRDSCARSGEVRMLNSSGRSNGWVFRDGLSRVWRYCWVAVRPNGR
jgi:UDP-N-acetylenolpyruvoylglucosamine reductase